MDTCPAYRAAPPPRPAPRPCRRHPWPRSQRRSGTRPRPPTRSPGVRLARAAADLRLAVVLVQHRDEVDADLLRARRLALTHVGARAEVVLHHVDHALG